MKPTQQLHDLGQSLWLDNITRGLLTSGTLLHYIGDLSVTGLTSNPSIFDLAVKNSTFYDNAIRQKTNEGKSGERLFFELAIEDLAQAADLFRPIHDATAWMAGYLWRFPRYSPTMRPTRSRRPLNSTLRRIGAISSSKFRVRAKESLQLKRASSREYR